MAEQALAEGRGAQEVLQEGLIAGMSVVGEDFKHNRVYVPQVLIAARAMKAGMAVLKPLLTAGGGAKSLGTVIMGTVKGDLHDIGKNLVGHDGRRSGVHDRRSWRRPVGRKIRGGGARAQRRHRRHERTAYHDDAVHARRNRNTQSKKAWSTLRSASADAPVSQTFAEEIGADGYGPDATRAVELFKELYPVPA